MSLLMVNLSFLTHELTRFVVLNAMIFYWIKQYELDPSFIPNLLLELLLQIHEFEDSNYSS